MNIGFAETQKFGKWIMVLIIIISLLPLIGLIVQIGGETDFGNNPMSNEGLGVILIVNMLVLALFLTMKMETTIDQNHLNLIFFPFIKKSISWNEVKSAKVIDYGFVGGWGIRKGTKYGPVYNMKGSKGLAIELKNGKRFLIGTQQGEKLEEYIKNFRL